MDIIFALAYNKVSLLVEVSFRKYIPRARSEEAGKSPVMELGSWSRMKFVAGGMVEQERKLGLTWSDTYSYVVNI